MNIVLWVLQALVALAFAAAGLPKATQPIDALSKRMDWVGAVPPGLVRFIGISEFLGALGLILPGLFHWGSALTVAAATGLAVIMILAIGFHVRRKESQIIMNAVLLIFSLAIAIGRLSIGG